MIQQTDRKAGCARARWITLLVISLHHTAAWADELAIANTATGDVLFYARNAQDDISLTRILQGGRSTRLNGPVCLAFDPVHDELVTTNISSESVTVFNREDTDGAVPKRLIRGESTDLSSPTAAVVDVFRDELVVANGFGQSISFFDRTAQGDQAPRRSVAGAGTQLAGPRDIALDSVNSELLITNITTHSITVFRRTANGNEAPLRVISGSGTGLNGPRGIVVDPVHDEIFVANIAADTITVYSRSADGDAAPIRSIGGQASQLQSPVGLALDLLHDELVVVGGGAVRVFDRSADGDVAPLRSLVGPSAGLSGPTFASVLTNPPLVSAILPASRSVQVGSPATAFATIINAGAGPAAACGPSIDTTLPVTFSFRVADAVNNPTGAESTPANIPAGGSQNFVFAITPQAAFAPVEIALRFTCADTMAAGMISGVNTLQMSASPDPVPDIVALAATIDNDGVVKVTDSGVFAVAAANIGIGGQIRVDANTGATDLPLQLLICQTDPQTSDCLADPVDAGSGVTVEVDSAATPTFGVFLFSESTIPLDPANHRVYVRFVDGDDRLSGLTSVRFDLSDQDLKDPGGQ